MKKFGWRHTVLVGGLYAAFVLYGFYVDPLDSQSKGAEPIRVTAICGANKWMAVAQKADKEVALYSDDFKHKQKSWKMAMIPTGITTDDNRLFVTTGENGSGGLVIINLDDDTQASVPLQNGATSPTYSRQNNKVYVCNQFSGTVSEVDCATMKHTRSVKVLREPKSSALSEDGRLLFVTNFLPLQAADADTVSACVSVIDLKRFEVKKEIHLANGSNALRGIALSPDGKYIFVSHNLGRFQVPTSQLQQGWMNTNVVSVISVDDLSFQGAVLLDEPEQGAAGIWDIRCLKDRMVVSHSGTHEISVIDYPAFIRKFEQTANKDELAYDLRFLQGVRERVLLKGNGPRSICLKDDQIYVPTYFSDTLNILNMYHLQENQAIAMAPERMETAIHRGEKYFNDASYCFQGWQSCNGCHPGDARTDGMNWDLLNDGIGNPKNCKSMLFSHVTAPCMISGIRAQAEIAVRAGYKFIQFCEIPEDYAACVDDYLRSLQPVPSPYLVNGELSPKALRGRKVFENLNCVECHSGPYFTDLKMHRIGENIEFEQGWDTPTLREVWRTAPYLFDGRAVTMQEVFSEYKHGIERKVSQKEIDELVEYVNSL